jgi:hypothetical protein
MYSRHRRGVNRGTACSALYNSFYVRNLALRQPNVAMLVFLLGLGLSTPARAQDGASEPVVLGGGRLTVGGDASATFSCSDSAEPGLCGGDTGFFNYSDYDHSTLRMLRLDINAALRASRHVSVLAEVRAETGSSHLQPYALYVRLRPWTARAFDIQVGRIPPTFGAFARRSYANDNLLIGYPLAYQYLTSLRPDAVPASADELLGMRGRGWRSSFSLGNPTPDRGVPLVSAFRWDTGVQVHSATRWAQVAASVTTGSLANPLVSDDNGGKQLAGRISVHPVTGLVAGASVARGSFLGRAVARTAASAVNPGDFVQSALGADVEYSRDYYLLRAEMVRSTWTLPTIGVPLGAFAISVEGRYKVHPRLYFAARHDHLGFTTVTGLTRAGSWDAPVARTELGAGFLARRNVQLKAAFQRNSRRGSRVSRLNIGAVQAVYWF